MRSKTRVIYRRLPHSRYTAAVLLGLLDEVLEASLFDVIEAWSRDDLLAGCAEQGLVVVAYSVLTPDACRVQREIQALRRRTRRQPVILCGGPHVTARPEEVLSWGADAVFVGESEESLPEFLRALEESKRLPDDRIVQPKPLSSLDTYPPFAASRGLFAPIEVRRGCANRCSFCQTPRLFSGIKERSIEAIVGRAGDLVHAGKRRVALAASDALLYGSRGGRANLAALESLLDALRRLGLRITFGFFPSEVGPATLARSPEAASLLRRFVAHQEIVIGAQSASPAVLRTLQRPHTVEDVETAVEAASRAGFTALVDILMGTPGEGRDGRRETLDWMKRTHARFGARFNLHRFIPLPGTPLEDAEPERIERSSIEALQRFLSIGVARGQSPRGWPANA